MKIKIYVLILALASLTGMCTRFNTNGMQKHVHVIFSSRFRCQYCFLLHFYCTCFDDHAINIKKRSPYIHNFKNLNGTNITLKYYRNVEHDHLFNLY